MGYQDRECWLGLEGKPHKIPLDMGLDILQIMLMSCLTPCMVLSWAFGNGQSEPAPMTAPVGRSVHRMGWMIRLFFIHLFTLR